jgi:mRNA interferase RelE/StbE
VYKLAITNRFKRTYNKQTSDIKDKVDDAIRALLAGRPYPKSLRVKKMKGHKFVFEASPTMDIRITFHYINPDYIVLRNVGEHEITLNNL